jgi:hypothetical protein
VNAFFFGAILKINKKNTKTGSLVGIFRAWLIHARDAMQNVAG